MTFTQRAVISLALAGVFAIVMGMVDHLNLWPSWMGMWLGALGGLGISLFCMLYKNMDFKDFDDDIRS